LWAQAGRLAQTLRAAGVGPEVRVGAAGARSADLIVACLGILRAGGAYVPLDPQYPAARLAYLREDAGVHGVVTTGAGEAEAGARAGGAADAAAGRRTWIVPRD